MSKKIKIIIIIAIILLVLLCGGITFAYFFTDIFKSDKEMFFKYISENTEILDILKDEELEKYRDKQQNSSYTSNGSITINNVNIGDLDENTKNIFSGSSISFTGSKDPANNYEYKNFKLNYSDTESIVVEYANIQDYYGIKIDDVVNKFVAIENNNLKSFATMLGVDESSIDEIPDKIDFSSSSSFANLFTDEELTTLKSRYQTVLMENLTDEMFAKSEDAENTIYTVTLTEDQARNLLSKLLEQLKDDDIILNKMKELMIENNSYTETEADKYISQLKENIQDYIDELSDSTTNTTTDEMDNNSNIVINVYVQDKVLVKTELLIDGDNLSLSKSNSGFSIEYLQDGETSANSITFEKTKSADTLEYKFAASSQGSQQFDLTINFSGLSTLEQVQEGFTFAVNMGEDSQIGYTYSNTKNFNISGITQEVTVDDMLSLNTAPDLENIQNLFGQIETRLDEVHTAHMANLGLVENTNNQDPFIYYAPAVIPLGVITGIQSDTKLIGALPIGLGVGIYLSASSSIVGEDGIIVEATTASRIASAKDKALSDLNQVTSNYYAALLASDTPYEGTLLDYVRQNWVSSDETLYTVNGLTISIVGTDITGEVQENGTIEWSDSKDTNLSDNLKNQEVTTFNNSFTSYIGNDVSSATVNTLISSIIASNATELTSGTGRYITITFPDENGNQQIIGVQDGAIYYSNESGPRTVETGAYYTVTAIYNDDGYIESMTVTKN